MPKKITRVVKLYEEELTREQAKNLVVEAKIFFESLEIDAYERCTGSTGFLSRLYTVPVPEEWKSVLYDIPPETVLEYARECMPDDITFGR